MKYNIHKTKETDFTDKESKIPLTTVTVVTEFSDTDVENEQKYKYKIDKDDNGVISDFSDSKIAVPFSEVQPVVNLVGVRENNTVTLSWNADLNFGRKGIVEYLVYMDGLLRKTILDTTAEIEVADGLRHLFCVSARIKYEVTE